MGKMMMDGEEVETCDVCGEPKQYVLHTPEFLARNGKSKQIVSCLCACQKKELEEEEERRKQSEKCGRIAQLKKLSLMDERLKDVDLKSFAAGSYCKGRDGYDLKFESLIMRYIHNIDQMIKDGNGILFYGDVGTGKTYAAAVIANEVMRKEIPVVMTSFIRLLNEAMKFDHEDYIRKLNEADLLIIDDLGAERGTDFALEKVYEIIDERYRCGKPLILTTNMMLSEMTDETDIRYTRIYDRIFEMCYPFHVQGVSWRKAKAAENFDKMQKMVEG